jgi:hypothetical protein
MAPVTAAIIKPPLSQGRLVLDRLPLLGIKGFWK